MGLGVSEQSRSHMCADAGAKGSVQAVVSKAGPCGMLAVVASSWEDEQCIPLHCLTHAWFQSFKKVGKQSCLLQNNRKTGLSTWLKSGEAGGTFSI